MSNWQYQQSGNPFGQDNTSTQPSAQPDFHPEAMKQAQAMIPQQALVDTTLDFVPGAAFGKMGKLGMHNSIGTAENIGWQGMNRAGDGAINLFGKRQELTALYKANVAREQKMLDKGTSPELAKNHAYRPIERNLKGVYRTGNMAVPSPRFSMKKNIHDYKTATGIYRSNDVPHDASYIEVTTKHPAGYNTTKFERDSSKRHEYNHHTWHKKYGSIEAPSVGRGVGTEPRLRDLNNDSMKVFGRDKKREQYLSKPYEINARARESQFALQRLRKDPDDIEALDSLTKIRRETSPFIGDFMKQYPDEMGDYLLKGYDYLDNARVRRMQARSRK